MQEKQPKKRSPEYKRKRRKQYRKKKKELWQELAIEALQKRCQERVAHYNTMLAADREEEKRREEKLKTKTIKELKAFEGAQHCQDIIQYEEEYLSLE